MLVEVCAMVFIVVVVVVIAIAVHCISLLKAESEW